jgi:hypothetical protein
LADDTDLPLGIEVLTRTAKGLKNLPDPVVRAYGSPGRHPASGRLAESDYSWHRLHGCELDCPLLEEGLVPEEDGRLLEGPLDEDETPDELLGPLELGGPEELPDEEGPEELPSEEDDDPSEDDGNPLDDEEEPEEDWHSKMGITDASISSIQEPGGRWIRF